MGIYKNQLLSLSKEKIDNIIDSTKQLYTEPYDALR